MSESVNPSQDPSKDNNNEDELPDLNRIINDLMVISKHSNRLALSLALYAKDAGVLDTTKYKLEKIEEEKN